MCGRFALSATTTQVEKLLPNLKSELEITSRYNIAPTQSILTVINENPFQTQFLKWGLVPSWSKDSSNSGRMINARSETLEEKLSFRNLFKKRRCLIFSDGFYEWKTLENSKKKIPHFIKLRSGEAFTYAGLWDRWINKDDNSILTTGIIITTESNELMKEIHHRMPVIIPEEHRSDWLENNDTSFLNNLLIPYSSSDMIAYEVSNLVNNPKYDDPACIRAVNNISNS